MVSSSTILKALPKFENKYFCLAETQSVGDIMAGIKTAHLEFAPDYDLIAGYFVRPTIEKTAKAIFDFLKYNTIYQMESDRKQTVKSPGAILETGKIDCKHLSLFAGGVLDAINRSGQMKIPFAYRFVSDNILSTEPSHVFIVINPGTDNEIFIDPIPQVQNFNDRITYYYSTDKKYKAMLYKVSGLDPASLASEATDIGIKNLVSLVTSLFAKKANPNDWQGWDAQDSAAGYPVGTQPANWILNDGDSAENEALNVVRYIQAKGAANVLRFNPILNKTVTIEDLAKKLNRTGFATEAAAIRESFKPASPLDFILPGSGAAATTKQAGTNIWLTLAIAAGAVYLIAKK